MSIRFSDAGPEFPEQLVDALLTGDVVFLCGAGVSAPQLPGFGDLVKRCFAGLNVGMSASEHLSFTEHRFEEALGSLSRRIVNPADMTRSVVAQLRPPANADLSHHRTILRLSRDLENRPAIVTTNFDTLIERALLETEDNDSVRALSFAGQDLPAPGSAGFGGIIHIHGRIADADLGLDETPLIVTSADYGDAYMRSGWASRFLFDLCRTKIIVLIGYSAGDAPVRYFLNVLEADRQRFPDLRPVYAIDAVEKRHEADVRWAALAVEPIAYEYELDADGKLKSHAALWPDLERLADLVERPRVTRRDWARTILSKPFADAKAAELDHAAWLFSGRRDLWSVAIPTIIDGDWFDFFAERKLWTERDASWVLAAWVVRDLASIDRFKRSVGWLKKLGKPFSDELARRIPHLRDAPQQWLRFWRILTISQPARGNQWEDRAYSLIELLKGPVVLRADLERAVSLLTPAIELQPNRYYFDDEPVDPPQRLSDLAWPRLTLPDRDGASDLVDALTAVSQPLALLEIATARLRATVGLSLDVGMIEGDYDHFESMVPSVEPHRQNAHHDGPIFLVELIARLLAPAIAENSDAVRAQALAWKTMPGTLGKRLWLHTLCQKELFDADEAFVELLRLSRDVFWMVRRELALVIRNRAGDARDVLVSAVEQRVLSDGTAYYQRYPIEEGQPDWRGHALDAGVWLRLNMLEQAGRLSAKGAAELKAIKTRHEYLARGVEEKDFFGSYSTDVHWVTGDASPIIDAADDERLKIAHEVLRSDDIVKRQGWNIFCRTNPRGAFDTLRYAPLDNANAPLWRDLISALSFPDDDNDQDRQLLVSALFSTLESAEAPFLHLVVDRLVDLYSSSNRRSVPAIAAWWPRLFAEAVARDTEPLDPTRDLYADLINSPGGRLIESVLIDIEAQRTAGDPIDQALLAALDCAVLAEGRQGVMARGALISSAGFVLTIEGQTVEPLLEAALSGDGDEATALRRVLLTNSRLSLLACRTFSSAVLRAAAELTGRSHIHNIAAANIIEPALSIIRGEQTEADWGMGVADAAKALRNGPSSLRKGVAELLKGWVSQIDPDRAVAWRTGIGPLLLAVWPRERSFLEPALTRYFADVAVHSGDAFPEAVEQLLPHMSLLEGHGGTYWIERSDVPSKFPLETLTLLWRLYGPGTTSDLHGVPEILDRLIAALPSIELDRRLQWLDQKATRYD